MKLRGGEGDREEGLAGTLLGREQGRNREDHERSPERSRETQRGGTAPTAAWAAQHDRDVRARARHHRVDGLDHGRRQHDARGLGDELARAGDRWLECVVAEQPREHGEGQLDRRIEAGPFDHEHASASQRRARSGRGDQLDRGQPQKIGARREVERGRLSRCERVDELAGIEIERIGERGGDEPARGRIDAQPPRHDRQPRLLVASMRDELGRLRARVVERGFDLGVRLAMRTLRSQRPVRHPRERGRIAKIDLRWRARVEAPQQRCFGVQPELLDHRGKPGLGGLRHGPSRTVSWSGVAVRGPWPRRDPALIRAWSPSAADPGARARRAPMSAS